MCSDRQFLPVIVLIRDHPAADSHTLSHTPRLTLSHRHTHTHTRTRIDRLNFPRLGKFHRLIAYMIGLHQSNKPAEGLSWGSLCLSKIKCRCKFNQKLQSLIPSKNNLFNISFDFVNNLESLPTRLL